MDLLRTEDLTKKFGGLTAVDKVSLMVDNKAIIGLIGPNGSGKTTLFNLIVGIYKPDKGNIFFKGDPIIGLKPHQIIRKGIGRTFQITRVFKNMTVLDNLVVVGDEAKIPQVMERALELLESLGLTHLRDEYAGNLSYGQQKLLELSKMLIRTPDLLLLDEPTAGINPVLIKEILDFILELRNKGKSIFIIEHNMAVIGKICDKIFVLDHGKKIAEGTIDDILRNKEVKDAYLGRAG